MATTTTKNKKIIYDCEGCGKRTHKCKKQYDDEMKCEECFETEYGYYGYERRNGKDCYIVAGGGLGNGNAYAEVIDDRNNKKVMYVEYGQYPRQETYNNSKLRWEVGGWGFDVVPFNTRLKKNEKMCIHIP